MKLTERKLVLALVNLRGNSDFQTLMAALKEDERDETTRSLKLEGAACHRAQGAVLKLQEIEKSFADAPDMLTKFKQQG